MSDLYISKTNSKVMMNHNPSILITGLFLFLGFCSCNKELHEGEKTQVESDTTIHFITERSLGTEPRNSSRNAHIKENFIDGDAFSVWAREIHASHTTLIFDDETVTRKSGRWTYENLRYWKKDASYSFWSIYPTTVSDMATFNDWKNLDSTPYLSIENFNATSGIDLMVAQSNVYTTPQPILMTFQHALTRINLKAYSTVAGTSLEIYSVKLFGLGTTASYNRDNSGKWSGFDSISTEQFPYTQIGITQTVTSSGTEILAPLFVHPQEIPDEAVFQISFIKDGAETTKNIRINNSTVKEWLPGQSYQYSIGISPDGYILFNEPQIIPWGYAFGGSINIG